MYHKNVSQNSLLQVWPSTIFSRYFEVFHISLCLYDFLFIAHDYFAGLHRCSSQTRLGGVVCISRAYRCRFSSSRARVVGSSDRSKLWMLIIPVTTFGLGTWQIFRLQWKLELIDELERKTKEDPITIPTKLVKHIAILNILYFRPN